MPAEGDKWQFAHRSIHDYLAARYMVEHGRFDPTKITVWNSRAAYAACLSHDATESIIQALHASSDIHAFSECLYNRALFSPKEVAPAVIEHSKRYRPFTHHRSPRWLTVETNQDFFRLATDEFQMRLIVHCLELRPHEGDRDLGEARDVVLTYALASFKARGLKVTAGYLGVFALTLFDDVDFTHSSCATSSNSSAQPPEGKAAITGGRPEAEVWNR